MNSEYFHPIRAARLAFENAVRSGKATPFSAVERLVLAALLLLTLVSGVIALAYFGGTLTRAATAAGPMSLLAEAPAIITLAVALVWGVRPVLFWSTLASLALTRGPRVQS